MILDKSYGRGTITGACSLLMALSMVINESLVARTFGTYTLMLFDLERDVVLVPALGVGLILFAFAVNISGNRWVGAVSLIMALAKIIGIALFAIVTLWIAGNTLNPSSLETASSTLGGFLAASALAILAYKGFTTITNSGSELVDPHKNVGRTIIISIAICVMVYLLVALTVKANLTLPQIIAAKDFALAEAARPALGEYGVWFTVILAIVATASGLIASVFAVSRMLTMLTDMTLIPHRHFGMPGPLRNHLLVYTVVIAIALTVFFDLTRIAALGAIFYLIMDIFIHWGILRHVREEVKAKASILITAIILDVVVLAAFVAIKAETDPLVITVAISGLVVVFTGEWLFLRARPHTKKEMPHKHQ